MRTTLTLDDDVAAQLERLRRSRHEPFRTLVNRILREGLRREGAPPARAKPFRTQAVDLGRCRLRDLDDVAQALAIAEGDSFR
jgi:hypothetical protein